MIGSREVFAIEEGYHAILQAMEHGKANANAMERFAVNQAFLERFAGGYVTTVETLASAGAYSPQKVAVVPLMGVMTPRGWTGFTKMGLQAAISDPSVSAIVLQVDSPGGNVTGTDELAAVVKNSSKPIVAFVDGMAASAAYWVSSQAKGVMISSEVGAQVGSVGVFQSYWNIQGLLDQVGIQAEILRASTGQDKVKPNSLEPITQDDRDKVQAQLDTIHAEFIGAIQGNRKGVKTETLTGELFIGRTALANGLADKRGEIQDAVDWAAQLARASTAGTQTKTMTEEEKIKAAAEAAAANNDASSLATVQAKVTELTASVGALTTQVQTLTETNTKLVAENAQLTAWKQAAGALPGKEGDNNGQAGEKISAWQASINEKFNKKSK